MNVRIRGIDYFYERHQDVDTLPTIVLLHGFLGCGKVFSKLIPLLKPFCNPITIDLLGHGRTEGAELHYRFSTNEQISDIVKLISEQVGSPLFLYGYSMGARLALQVSLQRSSLIQGLILESGTFGIEGDTERQARQALDAGRSDQIAGDFKNFLSNWQSMPLFKSNASPNDLTEMNAIQEAQNPMWMSNSLLGFGTGTMPNVREKLQQLMIPTQLVVGEKDSKFIPINQLIKKEVPFSKLSIIKDAGHRVHLDNAPEIAKILKIFITQNSIS